MGPRHPPLDEKGYDPPAHDGNDHPYQAGNHRPHACHSGPSPKKTMGQPVGHCQYQQNNRKLYVPGQTRSVDGQKYRNRQSRKKRQIQDRDEAGT